MLSFFWDFVRKLETRTREGDQTGFYKHLGVYVKYEDDLLLRDVELIRERWVRWFHTLLIAKSPRFDPNIAEGLHQWPENMLLGIQPTMQDLTGAIRSLANGKAVGPDEVSVELDKIPSTVIPPCAGDCSISSDVFGGGARCHSNGKMQAS